MTSLAGAVAFQLSSMSFSSVFGSAKCPWNPRLVTPTPDAKHSTP
ncbi:MAG: hypothetical protein WAW17_02740 [Rhodococcus sp. (in: high G+C Gram-positive bacteria)]